MLTSVRWLRAVYRDAVESGLEKFDVVRIRTTDRNTQRHTACISENGSLRSKFAAIGRVSACISPRPEAIWSSLRQHFANSTEYS